MSASSLADLLASQLPNGLAVRARTLLKTQAALDRSLPAALAGHVRVMQLENGVLSLACDSGAVASRLRHQTDTLLASLAKHGIEVSGVRIRVNPDLLARYVHPVEKAGLPTAALDGLAHLNAEIEDGPLKDALDKLLRHHRAG
ncbi:MAG: DciA family protein [Thiobacillus sp.]